MAQLLLILIPDHEGKVFPVIKYFTIIPSQANQINFLIKSAFLHIAD